MELNKVDESGIREVILTKLWAKKLKDLHLIAILKICKKKARLSLWVIRILCVAIIRVTGV